MLPRRAIGLISVSRCASKRPCRADLLRRHDHERGFAIGAILFILTMVGVGGAVLYSGYSQILRTNIEITRDSAAKNDLLAAARTLSATSVMINGGLNIQPPAVLPFSSADSAKLPGGYGNASATGGPNAVGVMQATAGTRQLDPWNRYYIYCRWENASSPGTDPALLLITAGPDGILNTACGDLVAQNDDRIERLSVAQAVDRANVWQYQPTSTGAQVQFGITGSAVQVTNQGDISANTLTLAGPLNAGALTLTTPLAVSQGGTSATDAGNARTNLGSGTTGDALFTATTAAGARGTLGSTTVGDGVFTAASASAARTVLGAGNLGSNLFTAGDATTARATLGASSVGDGLFIAADAAEARTTLGATTVGGNVFTATSAATARGALGAGTVGDAVFTAGTGAVARAAIGAGFTGDAVFAAANPNAALTALGLIGGSTTLDIGITGTANTAIYLADGGNILAGTVPVTRGGTGASDAATARANLGADNAGNLTGGTLSWSRLPTSGVTAGTYNWGTVNQYGLVEAAEDVAVNTLNQNNSGITVTDSTPGIGTDGQIVFNLEGSTRALMDYRGFLGLATTEPQDRLHISGGAEGNSALRLEGGNATERLIRFTTDADKRWELGVNETNEDGKNIGSDFVIRNYDDAGKQLGTPFSIERATGNVTINGTVTATNFVGGGAGSNIALGANAAASNPARSGEAGTGFFSPATGVVAVANNGGESLRVAANGYMGLGTTVPNSLLSLSPTNGNQAKITLWEASASSHYGFGITSGQLNYDTLGAHVFYSGGKNGSGTELMRLNTTGLGIGKTPVTKLDVNGTIGIGGVKALQLTSSGNPILGNTAMSLTLAPHSVAVGASALAAVTGEAVSVAVGSAALTSLTSGTNNTAVGYTAMYSTTTGFDNVAVGTGALSSNTTGSVNVVIGKQAMVANTSGGGNFAVNRYALAANTTGNDNIAIGADALNDNTTGSGSVAIGNGALAAVTTTGGSVAVGHSALAATTVGANTAVGYESLKSTTSGNNNTAVGYRALTLATGGSNTALGYNALAATTSGENNTGIGAFALLAQNLGSSNVALGRGALSSVTSGSNNLGLGYSVGSTVLNTGSNNILIGTSNAVTTPAAGTSNWINLGNQFVSDWAVTGSEAIGLNRNSTGTPGTTALIVGTGANNGNGALLTAAGVWTNASDQRIKDKIQPLGYGLDAIMRLRPVAYQMKGTQEKQIGFIAQEVEQVMPEVVVRPSDLNDPSQHYTLAYGNMVAATVKAIQDLKIKTDALQKDVAVNGSMSLATEQAAAQKLTTIDYASSVIRLLAGGIIVLLLGFGGLGMMVFRLRREVRRLQKVA